MPPLRLIASLILLCGFAALDAKEFYVSPQGDDTHDGRGPEPAQALRTIQAGVDRLQPGDTLYLRAGTYRELVTFPRSGTAPAPITLRPFGREEVTITGCEPVSGWTIYDQEKNIWQAPMPWTLGLGRNQVFEDGNIRIEARYPNQPEPGLGMYVADLSPLWPTFAALSIENPQENPGRIVGKALEGFPDDYWKGACYYGVHFQGWAAQTGIVESSKPGEITVGDRTQTWWFGSAYGGRYKPEDGRGMLVGHMHALDQPGEWCWQDDTLYLMTEPGKQPTNVEAKRRQLAFDLSGQEYIELHGLAITAASMRLQDSAHCLVNACQLSYISHYRRHYAIGQIEKGKDTIKSGETGIFVGGHDNTFTSCSVRFSAGAGFYLRGYHHTIHNCLIDEIDYTSHYLNAITDAVSDFGDYENFLVGGHVITYNTMRNAGRHFFNFYGNGTSTASRNRGPMDYMATLFAHNHLYNGMLQTKDAGFITGYYSSGGTLDGLNSEVAYNVMHDCYDTFGMRIGALGIVYLDAGSCDVDLHHNLLWAAPGSHQRGLWYNTMCVDIHEDHNLFFPEFTRTCADLLVTDFPEARTFRFGHDFARPPAVPTWPRLVSQPVDVAGTLADGQAISAGKIDFGAGWQSAILHVASDATAMNTDRSNRAKPRHTKATDPLVLEVTNNDGLTDGIRRQWTFMYNVAPGAWIRFNQVPLGDGYRRFRAVYGNDQTAPRRLEVHLDQPDGPQVGTVDLPQTDHPRTGRIQIYAEATGTIAPEAVGTHDVFLVFRSDDATPVGEFEYFRFEQYRGSIPLAPTEVKLELRLDRPDGTKIGEFYPRATGGPGQFRDLVASLEPVTGEHELFLATRSALAGECGLFDSLRLEKASQPVRRIDSGLPLDMVKGRLVLPKPTNRPCARPNDIIGKKANSGPLSRPLAIATANLLRTPPQVDGSLADWPAEGALTLAESYDGSSSAGPASQVWLGYDHEALYVAARHPVKNAASLLPSNHQWGTCDGMEVAFREGLEKSTNPVFTLYGYPDGHFESMDYGGAPAVTVARLQRETTYAATVGTDGWQCEWRIPFASCGLDPIASPLLLFNVGVRKTEPDSWVVWRGTGGENFKVATAGMLVLGENFLATWQMPLDGLAVWLDASDRESVVTDDGGTVSLWRDKSGKHHDANQTNPLLRPGYAADGLNGLPALIFDERRKTRLELPDLADDKITATIFAVFSNPVAGAEVNHDPRLFTASDGKGYDFQVGLAATIPGMQAGGPRQSVQVFKDRWAKQVRIGCFSPNYQTFFTGQLAEILVFTRELEVDEWNHVRAYLDAKWRLP